MQLNYRRHENCIKNTFGSKNLGGHVSQWFGMMFLSVLFRQTCNKDYTISASLVRDGYRISSIYKHCWFRLACTEISAHLWSHSLFWTQNWRVTVRHVWTCGKSPRLQLSVTLTLVPLPMSDDDYRSDPNQNNIPVAERWHRLATCPSAPLLCLRAVCQAMPCRRRTRVVSHFYTPSSAHFLPSWWPKWVKLDKLLEHIAASSQNTEKGSNETYTSKNCNS